MMKNKLFGLSMSVLLTTSILLMSPKTNAKFFIENFGVAWENYFTEFTQLKDVFFITNDNVSDDEHSQDKLWGTTDIDATPVFGNESSLEDTKGIYAYGGGDGFNENSDNWYEPPWYEQIFDSEGEVRLSKSEIQTAFKDYLIENLTGIEINVVNQSNEDVVVTFEVHYYGPKLSNETDKHFTFELYNTIEHPDGKTETIDGTTYNYALRGEFLVNLGSADYSIGAAGDYPDIPVSRNSGNDGAQIYVDRVWYYPHRADINPYHMLYDDGTGNKYAPYHEYYNGGTRYYSPYTNGQWDSGNKVAFRYPAWDNTSKKNALTLMPNVNINDFILTPSEAGSFNLSLYYGTAANPSTNSGSFVTALCLKVETLDKARSDYEQTVQDNINYPQYN